MSSPITQSAVSGILKELYDDQKVQWLKQATEIFFFNLYKYL